MDGEKYHNSNHREKMRLARSVIAAKKIRERLKLDRFPDCETGDNSNDEHCGHKNVERTLNRIVDARGMSSQCR